MFNTLTIVLLIILLIILIEYSVDKKYLGIVILHNNDHTLNKVLQYIISFMQRHEIHYQILIIKEYKPEKNKKSTGYLFNIGMRQLSGFKNYLFIDTSNCNLNDFQKLNSNKKINKNDLFNNDKITLIDKICGISISREYFKKIDGFSNKDYKNFNEFIKELSKTKRDKYGGYFSMNLNVNYDIIDRVPINPFTTRLTIKHL